MLYYVVCVILSINTLFQQSKQDLIISVVSRCGECGPGELETGPVCGTDGKNYQSACDLRQVSCSLVRRQGGRSYKTHEQLLIIF